MKKVILALIITSFSYYAKAQNLFPYKLNNCVTDAFCLDCGDIKANVDVDGFNKLIANLNATNNYKGISGKILLQVLIDSLGNGCVLSHTDKSNSIVAQNIVKSLNGFGGWVPAKTNGKIERKTSINLSVEIKSGVLTCNIERVDNKAFMASFDRPVDPEIFNKTYSYKNEHLKNYNIEVWGSKNSNLPNNMTSDIAIDKNNLVWLTIDEGLVKFDGKAFLNAEQNITDKGNYFAYSTIAVDNNNIKWTFGKGSVYSYDDNKWTIYDPEKTPTKGAFHIINSDNSGEVFFCTSNGITVYKNGSWNTLDLGKSSKRVSYAKRDKKNRLWIGTYDGSILIDETGKQIDFENGHTVLKGKCISSMDEDENGTIYLGLYEFNRKNKQEVNNDEGIAIYYPNGEIKQFNTSNSGMPFNHVTKVLYDKMEKVLWIATDRAGLVRYDLKNNWENYHNKNSEIPTSYIADMAFDNNGTLFLATRQGLVKMQKK